MQLLLSRCNWLHIYDLPIQINLVDGVIAVFNTSGLVKSRKVKLIALFGLTTRLKYLWVPPYTSSIQMTLSPALKVVIMADVAAIPEEYAIAYLACSHAAIALSNAPRVGLPVLYSIITQNIV